MTTMNISSAHVEDLVRQLARLTGEDAETAVERAVQERLSRIARKAPPDRRIALRAFLDRMASLKTLDDRQPEEIIKYGQDGLPV
jgi:hypothetical protein